LSNSFGRFFSGEGAIGIGFGFGFGFLSDGSGRFTIRFGFAPSRLRTEALD